MRDNKSNPLTAYIRYIQILNYFSNVASLFYTILTVQFYIINTVIMSELTKPSDQQKSQSKVSLPDCFSYQFFQANRYTISQNDSYEAICNNGFIKLYTKLCRVYWHTQNQFNHQVHDWKFHVSVRHEDLKKAWNLIAGIFIKMQCRAGMKVIYLRQCENSQPGREITIYLIKIDPKFQNSSFAGDFGLSMAVEHSEDYWFNLCRNVEECLASNQIVANGLADGDYPLGKYISFRNEAFVESLGNSIYPPNSVGWNPLKYELPIDLKRFETLNGQKKQQKNLIWRNGSFVLLAGILIAVGLLGIKIINRTYLAKK